MSSAVAAQACALVAPEKLPDRFLASGILCSDPTLPLSQQVMLAYVFEVARPWLPSSHLLPSVQELLTQEFEKIHIKHDLDAQFEDLLKAVNNQLNSVSEAGETDWIGNLSGLIVLLGHHELHFSQTGSCPAYLLQNNRIRQITDDLSGEGDPHPLKTFSNLASGTIKAGDQILFANSELYGEISLDALRRIMNAGTPYASGQAIAKELRAEKNPKVAACLIRILEPDQLGTIEPMEISLEEQLESPFKRLHRKLSPTARFLKGGFTDLASVTGTVAKKAGEASIKVAKHTGALTKDKLMPAVGSAIQKGMNKIAPPEPVVVGIGKPVIEHIPPKKEREKLRKQAEAELELPPAEEVPTQHEDEFVEAEIGTVIHTEAPAQPKAQVNRTPLEKMKFFLLKKLPYYILTGLHKFLMWLQVPGNKKKAALGLAALLIVITVWGVFAQRNNPTDTAVTSKSEVTATLNEVRDLQKKITTAVSLEQYVEASRDIDTAYKKLRSLAGLSAADEESRAALWESITIEADVVTKTTRLAEAASSHSFASPVSTFFTGLPYFYGFESLKTSIVRTGKGDAKQVQATVTLPSTQDPVVAVASTEEADTAGYLLTKESKIYRVVQIGNTTTLSSIAPEEGTFAFGDGLTTYAGNIYILSGKNGQVWRYRNTGTRYSKGTAMISEPDAVGSMNSVSVAIDGSVYLLKADGKVLKFLSGRLVEDFALTNVPTLSQKLTRPKQIITRESINSIYILDAGDTAGSTSTAKVLEFTKSGAFVRQYAFPSNFTDVRAVDINQKDKKLWVLNESTVHEFSLP